MKIALKERLAWLPAPGTMIVVAGLMAGLYAVDRWLAALETREVNAEARGLYASGEQMLRAGDAEDAVNNFRRARYLDRGNRAYELALADAQLGNHRADEAKTTLENVLDRDSNDARANLLMARALVSTHELEDADSYYHRAIYGEWRGNAEAEKSKARVELAEMLAKEGKKQELLSEVLLLANDSQSMASQSTAGLRKKVAEFYLQAGSPGRAGEAYRAMISEDSRNGEAYLGLGQAELQLGVFRAAETAFRSAVRLLPGNQRATEQVQVAEKLVDLDPTSRRLSSVEKFRRSRQILSLTEASVVECLKGKAVPDRLHDLMETADGLQKQKALPAPTNEMAEAQLTAAQDIWKARVDACGAAPVNDVLTIIHRRIDQ